MVRGFVATACLLLLSGCATAAARPELVVFVDTDLPVFGTIGDHPDLSPDASIDTLRVDVLSVDGQPSDVKQFLIAKDDEFPLSFGIPSGDSTSVELQIRAFRSDFADVGAVVLSEGQSGSVSEIAGVIDPVPSATVDRVVVLDLPTDGVRSVLVTLHGDCIGVLPAFGSSPTTCIDASKPHVSASSDVDDVPNDGKVSSKVGTWLGAKSVPCTGTPPSGSVCIPGGFTMMGNLLLRGESDPLDPAPFPLHPMIVSPYFLDVTEYTVGRLQARVQAGYAGALPETEAGCMWANAGVPGDEDYPVNCIEPQDAAAICGADGGVLPSEAQWEHAARGRGEGRLYPWGNDDPSCCIVSAARAFCATSGGTTEKVQSHPATCKGGLGDVSRDGVYDLGGSLLEAMQDGLIPFDEGCWNYQGVAKDLICGQAANVSGRGGSWLAGLSVVASPLRHTFTSGVDAGFRCAYPDSGG